MHITTGQRIIFPVHRPVIWRACRRVPAAWQERRQHWSWPGRPSAGPGPAHSFSAPGGEGWRLHTNHVQQSHCKQVRHLHQLARVGWEVSRRLHWLSRASTLFKGNLGTIHAAKSNTRISMSSHVPPPPPPHVMPNMVMCKIMLQNDVINQTNSSCDDPVRLTGC